MYVDSHIHLTHSAFEGAVPCIKSSVNENRIECKDRDQLICELRNSGITACIEPGIDMESNYRIRNLADKYRGFILPAVGIHPTRVAQTSLNKRRELILLAEDEAVVAIGEIGLDYHYGYMGPFSAARILQKNWFGWQLKLAYKMQLPVVLHIRQADNDAIKILRRYKDKLFGGVCHCFNQGPDIAKVYTEELGLLLGIGGVLLQEDSEALKQTVIDTPLEYLILETDGPYVKPKRPDEVSGKKWKAARNTSMIIPDIAARIAELKGIDVEDVARITTENVNRMFKNLVDK